MQIIIITFLISFFAFGQAGAFSNFNFSSKIVSFEKKNIGKVLGVFDINEELFFKEPGWYFANKAFSSTIMLEEKNLLGLPENGNKVLPVKIEHFVEFSVNARNSAAIDLDSDILLFAHDADKRVPIASITKLMTALIFLENNPGWDAEIKIEKEDRVEGGRIYLYWGEEVTARDLFNFSLVGSDNTATMALARSTGLSLGQFVEKMNQKAKNLGLEKTNFVEPVGINDRNVSTAREVLAIAKKALEHEEIKEATLLKEYSFTTKEGRFKKVYTTDQLLDNLPPENLILLGGKTGYTVAAGHCFVGMFENTAGKKVVSVVLGADSNTSRFIESKKLNTWISENYEWK
jgi:serine-type D-Ala-D-Ala endopeptidase (penicillin-binding protein 7)